MLRMLALACTLVTAVAGRASAQIETDVGVEGSTEISGSMEKSTASRWWIGGYFRHQWVPTYVTETFFDRAPSITNNGGGLVATYRSDGSLNVQFGFGYIPYEFNGTLLVDGADIEDTETAKSDLRLLHLTGSLLWDIEFHQAVALELGVGLDLGVILGDLHRNEAYLDASTRNFEDCEGPMRPAVVGPNDNLYCAVPMNGLDTDPADRDGEQYDIDESRIPPVIGLPMLPHVALRVQPIEHLTIKAELGFGIAQIWAGASLHVSLGVFDSSGPKEVVVDADVAEAVPEKPLGRVLGRVIEEGTDAPVAGATVTVTARALSPLSTLDDGRFVVDRLDPGLVTFEIQHPDFKRGTCQADIGASGGDSAVTCRVERVTLVGAISGQVKSEDGKPMAVPIQVSGPKSQTLNSDETGVFAAVDLPVGAYHLRATAEGYEPAEIELQVVANETAIPELVLKAAAKTPPPPPPATPLVQVKEKEIVIHQQVLFKTGSAEILPESMGLMGQIAEVLRAHDRIELVEIQGHTDSRGGRKLNMRLSQERAESVMRWLVGAGIESQRLLARGYGPDHPIRSNDTADNRAKNRRVQFIILRQR